MSLARRSLTRFFFRLLTTPSPPSLCPLFRRNASTALAEIPSSEKLSNLPRRRSPTGAACAKSCPKPAKASLTTPPPRKPATLLWRRRGAPEAAKRAVAASSSLRQLFCRFFFFTLALFTPLFLESLQLSSPPRLPLPPKQNALRHRSRPRRRNALVLAPRRRLHARRCPPRRRQGELFLLARGKRNLNWTSPDLRGQGSSPGLAAPALRRPSTPA